MTVNEVKDYLREIRNKQEYLKRLKDRRASLHMEVSFGGIDYSADRVLNSPKNKMEEAMVKLSDRLESLDRTIARISVEIDDRIGCIEKLPSGVHKNLLYKRYVEGKSFEAISVEMGYMYNYTCNLHGDALMELSTLL